MEHKGPLTSREKENDMSKKRKIGLYIFGVVLISGFFVINNRWKLQDSSVISQFCQDEGISNCKVSESIDVGTKFTVKVIETDKYYYPLVIEKKGLLRREYVLYNQYDSNVTYLQALSSNGNGRFYWKSKDIDNQETPDDSINFVQVYLEDMTLILLHSESYKSVSLEAYKLVLDEDKNPTKLELDESKEMTRTENSFFFGLVDETKHQTVIAKVDVNNSVMHQKILGIQYNHFLYQYNRFVIYNQGRAVRDVKIENPTDFGIQFFDDRYQGIESPLAISSVNNLVLELYSETSTTGNSIDFDKSLATEPILRIYNIDENLYLKVWNHAIKSNIKTEFNGFDLMSEDEFDTIISEIEKEILNTGNVEVDIDKILM